MTDLERQILQWFADAWLGPAIMRVPWLFPTLESLHFIGVCFLFGSLLLVDLRLLGFLRGGSAGLAFAYLWITVGAFALLLATGLCFSSEERRVGKECVSKGRSRWSPCH